MTCPSCRAGVDVPNELHGKLLRCKTCREEFRFWSDAAGGDRRPRRSQRSRSSPLLSLLIVGGILGVCVVIAVVVVWFIPSKQQGPMDGREALLRAYQPRPLQAGAVSPKHTLAWPRGANARPGRASAVDGPELVIISNLRQVDGPAPNRPTYVFDYEFTGAAYKDTDHFDLVVKTPAGLVNQWIPTEVRQRKGSLSFGFLDAPDANQSLEVWIEWRQLGANMNKPKRVSKAATVG
jgi:hypothetical protein